MRYLKLCVMGFALSGCGGGHVVLEGPGDDVGFGTDKDVVSGADGTYIVGDLEACAEINGQCVDIAAAKEEACETKDAQADLVLDTEGKVTDVLCYPDSAEAEETLVESDTDGNISIPQGQNGQVIVFDPDTNGVPIQGNVQIDAESVTLFGNGVDETVIEGNLTMASNNAQVRSLTIEGNLVIDENANNIEIAFCRVYGNLKIKANNAKVLNCLVFGNIEIEANNANLYYNGINDNFQNDGNSTNCLGNYEFDDTDGDREVSESERGSAISCGGE